MKLLRTTLAIGAGALLTGCGDPKPHAGPTKGAELALPAKTIDLAPAAQTISAIKQIGALQEQSFRANGVWAPAPVLNKIMALHFDAVNQDVFGRPSKNYENEDITKLQNALVEKGFFLSVQPRNVGAAGIYYAYSIYHIGEEIVGSDLSLRAKSLGLNDVKIRSMALVESTQNATGFLGTMHHASGMILINPSQLKKNDMSLLDVATNEFAHLKLARATHAGLISEPSGSTHETYSNYVSIKFAQPMDLIPLTVNLASVPADVQRYAESTRAITAGLNQLAKGLGFNSIKDPGSVEKISERCFSVPSFREVFRNTILASLRESLTRSGIPSNLIP